MLYFIDKYGWPIERVKGHWISNPIRLLIHTRKITTKRPRCLDAPEPLEGAGRQRKEQGS